jgi:hypothetical protein
MEKRPAEIVVTEEMINVGMDALEEFNFRFDMREQAVVGVLYAMLANAGVATRLCVDQSGILLEAIQRVSELPR